MRFKIVIPILAVLLGGASSAFAWPACGGNWDVVPTGTVGTASSGYGAVVTEGGFTYRCTDPSKTIGSVNTNTNSNTSAGGNATGGSTGPISNVNTAQGGAGGNATATGGQGGAGGQGGSAQSVSGSSGSGNSTNVNEVTNIPHQTPMAYAPDNLNTSPCVKGFSGGGAGPMGAMSFGFSKTDKGCDSRQTAVIFHGLHNDFAAAKILCSTDAAKRAHLTLEECQRWAVLP